MKPAPLGAKSKLRAAFVCAAIAFFVVKNAYKKSYTLCTRSPDTIYTVEEDQPTAQCIQVHNGILRAVGSYDSVVRSRHSGVASVLDALSFPTALPELLLNWAYNVRWVSEGGVIVPGLTDAHAHVIETGYVLELPLMGCKSAQEVVERIKTYILSNPDVANDSTRWIEGMGWDHTQWEGGVFPTSEDLATEPLLANRLISLSRVDGHAKWVSPAVLSLIGPSLPSEVEGGAIIRDGAGNPTGIFVDNAMDLIPVPAWSLERMEGFYEKTMQIALEGGLTSIHDADTRPRMVEFYMKRAEEGTLKTRMYLMGYTPGEEYWGDKTPRLIDYGKQERLNLRSVKLFMDGALGSWGAALLEPYSDKAETQGILLRTPESMKKLINRFWEDGWQTNVHCIGDKANHVVLDIFEEIIQKRGANVSEWRPRIEHAQIFSPEDVERIAKLGVIPSVQPTHATSDMWYAETRLGPERIKTSYAYQTLLSTSQKQVLPLGSDFPVERVSPIYTFYAAVSRLSIDGTSPSSSPGGWYPAEKLSRQQALKGMTLDAAYASFAEDKIGSLKVGKKADFVVYDRDIMQVLESEILQAKVLATVVDGEVLYGGI